MVNLAIVVVGHSPERCSKALQSLRPDSGVGEHHVHWSGVAFYDSQ
jgi:hypothetical protein